MTPQQLLTTITDIKVKAMNGLSAWSKLHALINQIDSRTNPSNPLNVPLTQSQVDSIITVYLPKYQEALTAIEAAGDALGTDNFN